jgi:hypothetical protein
VAEPSLVGFVRFVVYKHITVTNIVDPVQLPSFGSLLPSLALHHKRQLTGQRELT